MEEDDESPGKKNLKIAEMVGIILLVDNLYHICT